MLQGMCYVLSALRLQPPLCSVYSQKIEHIVLHVFMQCGLSILCYDLHRFLGKFMVSPSNSIRKSSTVMRIDEWFRTLMFRQVSAAVICMM